MNVYEEWDKTLKELENARLELAHVNAEIAKTKDVLAEVEAQIYLTITKMTDENGKPIYTNESARQKAALLKASGDEKYTALKSVLRRYEEQKEYLVAKIANLKDRIELYKALAADGGDHGKTQ